ncbi:MAG: hypothetical protein ACR2MY_09525 [Candidatus Dormibacteria bacterium]
MRRSSWGGAVATAAVALLSLAPATVVRAVGPNVFLVGPAGTPGAQYTSIQAAVNHAQPGDWVLVAPGVYHEKGSNDATANGSKSAGVLITRPGIHLRGMDRQRVIVDGTNLPGVPGGAGTLPVSALSSACPTGAALQDLGPADSGGNHVGRNGVEAYKVSGVSIENMTVCNFMQVGGDHAGNEVWWDAGDSSGQTMPMTVLGGHLTATSTYYHDSVSTSPFAQYGIFTSNIAPDPTYGPSLIDYTYANNQADSAYYIGACPDCNIVLRHAHAENSALGYSGTNGSGRVILELGEWAHNRAGIVPNTLNNDDAPPPQQGVCPAGHTSPEPAARADECFVIRNNFVHDNNNPSAPGSGIAAFGPVGVGIELSGTKGDAVVHNTVTNNASWGIAAHDYPDTGTFPSSIDSSENCRGGTNVPSVVCLFSTGLNSILANTLSGNGGNGNVTNGDLLNQQTPVDVAAPGPNCFLGNTDPAGTVSEYPPLLQESQCSGADSAGVAASTLALICASGLIPSTGLPVNCSTLPEGSGFSYPQSDLTKCAQFAPGSVAMGDATGGACIMPLAATIAQASLQPVMDPCTYAPAPPPNAYCPAPASPIPTTVVTGGTPNTSAAAPGSGAVLPGALVVIAVALGAARLRRRRA